MITSNHSPNGLKHVLPSCHVTEFTLVTRVLCSPCCHEYTAVEQLPQHVLPQTAATHTETYSIFNSVDILLKTSNRRFSNTLVQKETVRHEHCDYYQINTGPHT